MRCSAAFCVSLIFRLRSCLAAPKLPGLAEFLPRPLEPAAAPLAAGLGLPRQGLEWAGRILGRTGRRRQIGQHLGRYRAIVQGAERALQAHRRLDIGLRQT